MGSQAFEHAPAIFKYPDRHCVQLALEQIRQRLAQGRQVLPMKKVEETQKQLPLESATTCCGFKQVRQR
jgi:hypothetical protein